VRGYLKERLPSDAVERNRSAIGYGPVRRSAGVAGSLAKNIKGVRVVEPLNDNAPLEM
jgi:hypothetical protein